PGRFPLRPRSRWQAVPDQLPGGRGCFRADHRRAQLGCWFEALSVHHRAATTACTVILDQLAWLSRGTTVKALEFETKLGSDANLSVPAEIAAQIPKEESVRVIVLVSDDAEDGAWQRFTSEQFLRGYSETDRLYDAL